MEKGEPIGGSDPGEGLMVSKRAVLARMAEPADRISLISKILVTGPILQPERKCPWGPREQMTD